MNFIERFIVQQILYALTMKEMESEVSEMITKKELYNRICSGLAAVFAMPGKYIGYAITFIGVLYVFGAAGYNDAMSEAGVHSSLFAMLVKMGCGAAAAYVGRVISCASIRKHSRKKAEIIRMPRSTAGTAAKCAHR